MFGAGCYFAEDAEKVDQYARPDAGPSGPRPRRAGRAACAALPGGTNASRYRGGEGGARQLGRSTMQIMCIMWVCVLKFVDGREVWLFYLEKAMPCACHEN